MSKLIQASRLLKFVLLQLVFITTVVQSEVLLVTGGYFWKNGDNIYLK